MLKISDWSEISEVLLQQLQQKLEAAAKINRPQFLRTSCTIEAASPIDWLMAQKPGNRFYWKNRDGDLEMAGIGVADMVESEYQVSSRTLFRRLGKYIGNSGARYFGGIRFQQSETRHREWQSFGVFRFCVPQIELLFDGRYQVAFNLLLRGGEKLTDIVEAAQSTLASVQTSLQGPQDLALRFRDREDMPGFSQWSTSIEKALSMFRAGWLEKIVLARRATFRFADELPGLQLTRVLGRNVASAYTFCFEANPKQAFIGCSPERLYRRSGKSLESEALAGTRPRGTEKFLDRKLERELLNSSKDRYEHRLVLDNLRQAFEALCNNVEHQEAISVKKLPHLQHLYAWISGQLLDDIHDGQILDLLNPTPAVGGSPRGAALANIDSLEPFDRGWYAGPVGWVGGESSEFCVAIRSALVDGKNLHVYSGAGIVEGSEPESEWEEIENKIGQYIKILKPFLTDRSRRQVRATLKKNVDGQLI